MRVRELVVYPVKSMAGIPVESAMLGWHGLEGDRRFAFRRVDEKSDFPWLSASRYPELILYRPLDGTRVRTADGTDLALHSTELRDRVAERSGVNVELMNLRHGVFDEGAVSVISLATIAGISRAVGTELDRRRFRANIILETGSSEPFDEDAWIGGTLVFGDGESSAAVNVTMRDLRCMMINLDPDTAEQDARVMKSVVRMSENNAGVYGSVVRTGTIHVGQTVNLA